MSDRVGIGGKGKMDEATRAKIARLKAEGVSNAAIAERFGLSMTRVEAVRRAAPAPAPTAAA
jgi:hypothetical protein